MIHLCLFGAHGGELSLDKRVYITIFGCCELKRPTIARQIIEMRQRSSTGKPAPFRFFMTLFGSTEVKAPTLCEEYLDLQDGLRAGLLTLEEWDRAVAQVGVASSLRVSSFTLFGAFGSNELPSEDEELDRLALNNHLGHIPENAGRALMMAVGQDGSQRPAAVRQAIGIAQTAAA